MMKKRLLTLFSILLVFSMLLTACGGGATSTPTISEDVSLGSDVTPDSSNGNSTTTVGGAAEDTTAGEGTASSSTSGSGATASKTTGTTKKDGGNNTTSKNGGSANNTTKPASDNGGGDDVLIGGDGKLHVKDGTLYQPKNGKYNDFIKYRDTLGNTYNKLTSNKKLKVVYFGGSVTVGYGASNQDTKSWRALIGQWLKDTFPKAEVTNLNRGTGESGTYLGSYRFERDVVAANPDLVFIEYSINDLYAAATYAQAASQYEAIVRGIRRKLPECDIVTVLVTDQSRANGTLHEQAQAHEDVSIAYKIPTVHVGRALATHLIDNAFTDQWSNYMIDIVHPNDKGYNFYYEVIKEFMTACLVDYNHTGKVVKHTTPAQQCDILHNGNVTVIEPTAAVISRSEALGGKGFTIKNSSYGVGNYDCFFLSDDKDTEIVIEFTGTELVMLNRVSGIEKYYVKVDDGKYTTKSLTGINNLALNPTVLVTGLSSGKHTVYLQPVNPSGRSSIQIAAFYSRDAAKASRK